MTICVIGSSGGMGRFFVEYFLSKGETVRGSDLRETRLDTPGFRFFGSNTDAARGSDVVVIACPMEKTLGVASEILDTLKSGSSLVEISSVKGQILPKLRKLVGRRTTLLSIHPLFGPALASMKLMKMAVITPASSASRSSQQEDEISLAERLFPEARLISLSLEEHDKTIAVVLSLTHLVNLAYARTVAKYLTPEEFLDGSTPNSSMQLTLAEAILSQDPALCYGIQVTNRYSKRVAKTLMEELAGITATLDRADREKFREYFNGLANLYGANARGRRAIKEVYSSAEIAEE